jgi:hypothetical protein
MKTYLLIFPYLTLWIVSLIWYFGGVVRLINSVNNNGFKLNILLFSIVFFIPYFYIYKLIIPKIKININNERIVFTKTGKTDLVISIANISCMKQNENDMNSLNLYDKNESLIIVIKPNTNDNNLVNEIAEAIQQLASFKKETVIKKFLNTSYLSVIYQKM